MNQPPRRSSRGAAAQPIPKLCGADIEIGNFITGAPPGTDSAAAAAGALLREFTGVRSRRQGWGYGSWHTPWYSAWQRSAPTWANPQDVDRRFLAESGGCAYIDLSHLELCVPETLSAFDHVAAWHAMLRVARRALSTANTGRPRGEVVKALVNNSDGYSHSYGSHINVLVTRRTWDDIFARKLQHLLFLAAYQASSIVFTGQGKVGAENGAPPVAFQIAQRADFFESVVGTQTTFRRPLVNARDESLCGDTESGLARLHSIFFDNSLCQVATLLKVGVMQIILAMVECGRVSTALILDDALSAVRRWSHDPTLKARASLLSGKETTAVELQMRFLELAERFVAAGCCDGIVPRAGEIVALWADTLDKLAARNWQGLRGRLDWVLKRHLLLGTLRRHHDFSWQSPALKHLDHLYSSLDTDEGLYWACEREGIVETIVSPERIDHFVDQPPEDTRAWTRTMLLRRAAREIVSVDWDSMSFEIATAAGRRRLTLALDNPLRFTRADFEHRCRDAGDLEEMLLALGAYASGGEDRCEAHPPAPATH